jgi:hypothetical protein
MGEGKILGGISAPIKRKRASTKTPLIDKEAFFKNRALNKH